MNTQEIALIFNPAAARGKSAGKKKTLKHHLALNDISYRCFETKSELHLIETAARLVHEFPIIVGAGGDTTMTIIAREIIRAGTGNTLGVIGLGSINDLARELGVLKINKACKAIKQGRTVSIDVGAVRMKGQKEPFIFLSQVSLGLGVSVNRYVSSWMEKHQLMAQFYGTAQSLAAVGGFYYSFKKKIVPVSLDLEHAGNGSLRPIFTPFLIFTNTSISARNFRLSPQSSLFDGKLDCCIMNASNLAHFVKAIVAIKRRTHLEKKKMEVIQGKSFKLDLGEPMEMQADGEIFQTDGKVDIFAIPRALNIIVHPDFQAGLN